MAGSRIAVRVEDLWKTYRIHPPGARRGWWQRASVDFHALHDVNLEVEEGAVLGVIGRNGAGKSTLLKILSRITDPTRGRVTVYGRVASLLEVGTGFHPELTGRENIYLNAAIHGMKRRDVTARLPAIIDFAQIGEFLDEPVKRYSSGMYLRLAFSIAAHLDPDILIIDEILAVGDAAFRDKCFGKMKEVSLSGRTVVLVSHEANVIRTLCTRAVLLEKGKATAFGATDVVIGHYDSTLPTGTGWVHTDAEVLRLEDLSATCDRLDAGHCAVRVTMNLHALVALPDLHISVGIEGPSGTRLLQVMPAVRGEPALNFGPDSRWRYDLECDMPELAPGAYTCTVYAESTSRGVLFHQSGVWLFRVPPDPARSECLAPSFTAVLLPDYRVAVRPDDES